MKPFTLNSKNRHIIVTSLVCVWFTAVLIILSLQGIPVDSIHNNGLISNWIPDININGIISIVINAAIISITAFLLTRLNAHFPLIKEHTSLPTVFFLLLEMSSISLINHYSPANLTACLIYICIFILYTCYQQGNSPEQSFIVGLIFSIISISDAHALYLLPIFIVGFHLMRTLSIRTIIALMIGLITPYWIIWGMGWIEHTQLDFSALTLNLQWPKLSITLIPAIFAILLGMFTGTSNLLNAHTEKIQTRAYNGFINLLSVYTTILMCIDYEHHDIYLPVLNMCISLQAAYYFANKRNKINIILFYSIITLLLIWQIWTFWVA